MHKLILLTSVFLPALLPAQAPKPPAVLATALNGFAARLHGELAKAGNPTSGPASVSIALLMLLEGAAGTTQQEIAVALQLPDTLRGAALQRAARELLAATVRSEDEVKLTIVDDVWAQQGAPVRDGFAGVVRDTFGAAVRRLDFAGSPDAARTTINDHVAKATNDRIRDLLEPDMITADTRVVLTNAMWLKANWEESFGKAKDLPFLLAADRKVEVPAMQRTDHFEFAEQPAWTWVRLRYQDAGLVMDVVLPAADQVIGAAEQALLAAELPKLAHENVRVVLPKFTVKSKFRLVPALQALGIRAAFDGMAADFSPINGAKDGAEKLVVSEVAHQAWIQVDESGTEAAAATAVVMKRLGAPPGKPKVVAFDRPFAFAIRDLKTGLLLFVGRVTDPRGEQGT